MLNLLEVKVRWNKGSTEKAEDYTFLTFHFLPKNIKVKIYNIMQRNEAIQGYRKLHTRRSTIHTLHQILFQLSNQGELCGRGM
jgi:hypothetical protein